MTDFLYKVVIKVNYGDFGRQVLTTAEYYLQSMKSCQSAIALFTESSGVIESVEIKRMTLDEIKKAGDDNAIVSTDY